MVAEALPLTREAGVELLLQQAPIAPEQHGHSYDDEIDVVWRIGDQVIRISLETGETRAEWLSWNIAKYPDNDCELQYLDITDPATWQALLSELQC